ncbi:MAG: hypothetical protein QW835_00155 [Candidatus Hadarchaeum sp.]
MNRLEISGKDFPVLKGKGKFPIAKIEKGLVLDCVELKMFNPPKAFATSGSAPLSLAVGFSEDDEFFIRWFTPADLIDKVERIFNTGRYFSGKRPFDSETDVYLSYCFTRSLFSIGPSVLSSDTRCAAAGDGNTAFLAHGTSFATERFDGVGWSSSVNVLVRAEAGRAVGNPDRFYLTCGGNPNPHNGTQFFNGTAWTMFPNHPYSVTHHALVGDVSLALSYGGKNSQQDLAYSAIFNGISWSQGSNLNQVRFAHAYFGKPSDCIAAGGAKSGSSSLIALDSCEEFNGVAWYWIKPLLATQSAACGLGDEASHGIVSLGVYWVGSTTYIVNRSFMYNRPVWMMGPTPSQARLDATQAGTDVVGMLIAGHYWTNREVFVSTVEMLRPSVESVKGAFVLIFSLS